MPRVKGGNDVVDADHADQFAGRIDNRRAGKSPLLQAELDFPKRRGRWKSDDLSGHHLPHLYLVHQFVHQTDLSFLELCHSRIPNNG